jgi:hypothetical protein
MAAVALCVMRRRHIGRDLVLSDQGSVRVRQFDTSYVVFTVYRILHNKSQSLWLLSLWLRIVTTAACKFYVRISRNVSPFVPAYNLQLLAYGFLS